MYFILFYTFFVDLITNNITVVWLYKSNVINRLTVLIIGSSHHDRPEAIIIERVVVWLWSGPCLGHAGEKIDCSSQHRQPPDYRADWSTLYLRTASRSCYASSRHQKPPSRDRQTFSKIPVCLLPDDDCAVNFRH